MKICIDAGHNNSGWDTGAEGNGLLEQDITWLITKKLQGLLENIGIDVILTRAFKEQNLGTDVNSSLRKRVEICNFHNCDLFVSVHCNSSPYSSANGTETLIVAFGGEAEKLAKYIQSEIVEDLETENRGVKVAPLYVLKNTNCPAVLVETAFISNELDSLLLRFKHDDFAKAIFSGICKYLDIIQPKEELESVEDIVEEFSKIGIITEKEKWLQKLNADTDVYWLARKSINYIRGL